MDNLSLLFEYVKVNSLTLTALLFLLGVSLVKYIKVPFRMDNKGKVFLVLLFLGLALRAAWLYSSPHEPHMSREAEAVSENDLINIFAIDATNGIWFHDAEGNPTGRRPIGYPLFIALMYKIFGVHIEVAWMAQLALAGICIYLVFLIAQLMFSTNVALLASFFFAIMPSSVYSIKLITDEHLFLPLWYLGLYLLIKDVQERPLRLSWLWYGLIFGYATMIRTNPIFMPFVIAFIYLVKKRPLKQALSTFFLVAFVMQLINLPWVIRNYKAWGVPVMYTATGPFVYAQVNSTAGPMGGGHIPLRGEEGFSEEMEAAFETNNEGVVHQVANRHMANWIKSHPGEFFKMGMGRVLDFMCWNRKGGVWSIWYQFYEGHYRAGRSFLLEKRELFEEFAFISYYTFFFCSLFSLALIAIRWKQLSRNQKSAIMLFGSIFFFWLLEHMVIYPYRKYRFPLEPFMIMFGCYFLKYVLTDFRWGLISNGVYRLILKKEPVGTKYT